MIICFRKPEYTGIYHVCVFLLSAINARPIKVKFLYMLFMQNAKHIRNTFTHPFTIALLQVHCWLIAYINSTGIKRIGNHSYKFIGH